MNPEVVVLLITYERTAIARQTIRGIKERIKYDNLSWHIADDGSKDGHIDALLSEIGDSKVTVSNTGGHSVGRSMNMGIQESLARADYWLHWEDDWYPNFEIDLLPCVKLLEQRQDIGMIRLGRLTAGIAGEVISCADRLWWLLDKHRPWTWNGNASLRHRRFFDAYGYYREGLTPGKTELAYLDVFNANGGPTIVWPAWARYDICDHIGDGYSFKQSMESHGMSKEQAAEMFRELIESNGGKI